MWWKINVQEVSLCKSQQKGPLFHLPLTTSTSGSWVKPSCRSNLRCFHVSIQVEVHPLFKFHIMTWAHGWLIDNRHPIIYNSQPLLLFCFTGKIPFVKNQLFFAFQGPWDSHVCLSPTKGGNFPRLAALCALEMTGQPWITKKILQLQ